LTEVLLRALPGAITFTASLLAILLAHEFGHYLAARSHKSPVTLPYFLPFPGSLLGTLGAFIQLKAPPRNRRALLDIGLAGPLAGLAVALPVLIIGLSFSQVSTLPTEVSEGSELVLEGNSLLYLGLKYVVTGQWLPTPTDFGPSGSAVYWLKYFFSGLPIPLGGQDVTLHPMAWAGWAGLMVTALNLIPAGQLDGGHALYVLLGDRASRVWPFLVVGLAALGIVWSGWWLWAALIFFLGRTHAQPLDDITPLDSRRRAFAIVGIMLFVLVFTPVPLRGVVGG
jgi:membrane-associated protease RseP (regulator of RpoE activity)